MYGSPMRVICKRLLACVATGSDPGADRRGARRSAAGERRRRRSAAPRRRRAAAPAR